MTLGLIAFLAAFATAALTAPLIGRFSSRVGIVDRPDGHRKLHARSVPLTGGLTILLATVIALGLTLLLNPNLFKSTHGDIRFLLSLFASSIVIVGVGLIDDRFGMRGRQKLLGQFIAAAIMVPSGILIERITLFGIPIEFGDLSAVVTVFWILGAINALNLIDGVDGLASTTGIVLALSIAAVTYVMGGRPDGFVISLILAGALGGFLVYNFPPAKMFLGDSGSMLIGLILGCVALKCSIKQYTAVALIMPTAIWAIPIFDVAMAIIRRRLTGRSIYMTDRAHLHHCLQRKGHSGGRLLLIVGGLCALTGLGAVLGAVFQNDLLAVAGVATAILLLMATRTFGHAEVRLVANRVRRFGGSFIRRPLHENPVLHDEQVRLHGDHQWHELWGTLVEFAERFQMDQVEFMVNLPLVGEEYHATWRRKSNVEQHDAWRSDIPLIVDGMRVGQVKVVGGVGEGSICQWMSELIGGLKPFETQLITLIEELRAKRLPSPSFVIQPRMADSDSFRLPQEAPV